MIPKETVDKIIETARIEEVVGDFVGLKRRGVNMLGNCPFHNERTPSFTVSPTKGIYKCFGCGKAGNSVNFIMEHEHYTYPEALRYLAKKYNIEIEEKELTAEDVEAQNEKESLYIISSFAQKYFTEQLWDSENGKVIGLSYFRERGFRDDIIEKFQLGYSHDQWSAFTDAGLAAGFKLDYMEKTGLTIVKDEGAKKFDRFKGRVMFPIHNLTGRIIGFGGRVLNTKDKTQAKYVNSPESDIYNKSKTLYGIYFAKKTIQQLDVCYLVEGYTDVISLTQAGVENVVASSGTSLTHEQIKLISRYTKNITILYDGDPAGIKASFRGIDMILEEGMNVRVVLFPDGDDPDSYAKKVTTDELKEYIGKSAKDFVSFKTSLLLDEIGNDPIRRAGLVKDLADTIAKVPDGITRQFYIQECSRITGIDNNTLLREVNKLRLQKNKNEREAEEVRNEFVDFDSIPTDYPDDERDGLKDDPNAEHQERDIIRLLLRHAAKDLNFVTPAADGRHEEIHTVRVADYIVFELSRDEILLTNPIYSAIYTAYTAYQSEADLEMPNESHFSAHEDENIRRVATDLLIDKWVLSENWYAKHRVDVDTEDNSQVMLKDSVIRAIHGLKMKFIIKMVADLQAQMPETEHDEFELNVLLDKQRQLDKIKMDLSAILGRTILR